MSYISWFRVAFVQILLHYLRILQASCSSPCKRLVAWFDIDLSQNNEFFASLTVFRRINKPGVEADNEPQNLSNFNEIDNMNL